MDTTNKSTDASQRPTGSTVPLQHVPQVAPNIDTGSIEHRMFEAAEEIEDQLWIARHISKLVSDCGFNASLVDESHPGNARLDGNAIYNTLDLALEAIKKAESQLDEYRQLSRETLKPTHQMTPTEMIADLSEDNQTC
jgi:hypothetical protein